VKNFIEKWESMTGVQKFEFAFGVIGLAIVFALARHH
jgi:hypothetical protein